MIPYNQSEGDEEFLSFKSTRVQPIGQHFSNKSNGNVPHKSLRSNGTYRRDGDDFGSFKSFADVNNACEEDYIPLQGDE